MVAPLTPNYNTKQIESIRDLAEPRNSLMVLCPQGYFRDIQPDGSIIPRPFRESNLLLPHFELAMLSEADTPNAARTAQSWALHSLRTRIIVTKAADGAEIIRAHGDHMQIPTTPIDPNCIVDSVGCGDFFAMATAIAYWRNRGNLYKAIAEGHVAAAKKLTGIFAAT
jgi:sugar/nucleoside kinase (ribokinase family)